MRFLPGELVGSVTGTYVSKHPDKNYHGDDRPLSVPVKELVLDTQGIVGDRHYGSDMRAGGRMKNLYGVGTVVRNNRHWVAVSSAEVRKISSRLGLDDRLLPEDIGANFTIDGIDGFSSLPPMTYIVISPDLGDVQHPHNVVLVVYAQVLPCKFAGKALETAQGVDCSTTFAKAALGLRGICGWVEKCGIIRPGYKARVLSSTGKD